MRVGTRVRTLVGPSEHGRDALQRYASVVVGWGTVQELDGRAATYNLLADVPGLWADDELEAIGVDSPQSRQDSIPGRSV